MNNNNPSTIGTPAPLKPTTHYYFCLSIDQFQKLISICPSDPQCFFDVVYDDANSSLISQGLWLRKREGEVVLNKIVSTDRDSATYESLPADQIPDLLGTDWKDRYQELVLCQDVKRYYLDGEQSIYFEEVHFSLDEHYIVGVSTMPVKQASEIIKAKTGINIEDVRYVRSKFVEKLYGFEPPIYDTMVEKGFVKDAKYVCSRSCNRPVTSPSGEPSRKISFDEALKLWHLLEQD